MQTSTGKRFNPLKPDPESIDIEDIARALSKLCRYGGHCLTFYSVAEHSVLLARKAKSTLQLQALLHDASEAYINDLIRPVKMNLPEFQMIEDRLMKVIAHKFGFHWPLDPEIKRMDTAICTDERNQNMAFMDVSPTNWGNTEPALGVRILCLSPDDAYKQFMLTYELVRHK